VAYVFVNHILIMGFSYNSVAKQCLALFQVLKTKLHIYVLNLKGKEPMTMGFHISIEGYFSFGIQRQRRKTRLNDGIIPSSKNLKQKKLEVRNNFMTGCITIKFN
jgi:hypothetical protein